MRGGALLLTALAGMAIAGCGGEAQDANEPSGTYTVEITKASFPTAQSLAQATDFSVTVKNVDKATIPNVSVTIDNGAAANAHKASAFAEASTQPDLADPSRPVWIVDEGPRGGTTAYTNTWALGRLAPGASRTFVWHVTAVRSGNHTVRYRVSAGLDGKAKAQLTGGRIPEGSFVVNVTQKPPVARVDDNGNVVRSAD
jgi:hypothetical protein